MAHSLNLLATPKQLNFIRTLLRDRDTRQLDQAAHETVSYLNQGDEITKREASRLIDALTECARRAPGAFA